MGQGITLLVIIALIITYIVTRPRHVAVSELLIRPTEQVR